MRSNYENYKTALAQAFLPKERVHLYKAEFRIKRREPGESLSELAGAVRKLGRLAYPTAGDRRFDRSVGENSVYRRSGWSRDPTESPRRNYSDSGDAAVSRAHLVHLLILVFSFQWCVLFLCLAKLYRSCHIRDSHPSYLKILKLLIYEFYSGLNLLLLCRICRVASPLQFRLTCFWLF